MKSMNSVNRLVLYVNPAWHREGLHMPFLNPWWGNPVGEASILTKQMLDAHSFDTEYYTITDDIKKADMVFAPYRHNWLLQFDYR